MKRVDLMVFDLDGTLVTSGIDIAASVNHTLSVLGRPALDYVEIVSYIGDGVQRLIEKSLGPRCNNDFNRALEIFSSHYEEHMLDTTELYPSVHSILCHYQSKTKIIVTNKRYKFAEKMVSAFGIREFFVDIIGSDTTPYIKPDSRILHPLFERYGATPDETVIIGDGINDLLLAKNAGAITCAFLNGLGNREALLTLNPDFICEDLADLTELFC